MSTGTGGGGEWGVAMAYRNEILFTDKPVPQLEGLECLFLILGSRDRIGLLVVYWPPSLPNTLIAKTG